MNYITLNEIKQQCRIDSTFTADDDLLTDIGNGAEDFVQSHLNTQLDDITAENGGELPVAIKRAILMLVSYMYDNDGSGHNEDVPQAFWILLNPYKTYSIA